MVQLKPLTLIIKYNSVKAVEASVGSRQHYHHPTALPMMMLEAMLPRTMLASLCLFRATVHSLCHQRLATEIAGHRISRGARRYMTNDDEEQISVTGTVYSATDDGAPIVTIFTKDGCTLCDKVKDVCKYEMQSLFAGPSPILTSFRTMNRFWCR